MLFIYIFFNLTIKFNFKGFVSFTRISITLISISWCREKFRWNRGTDICLFYFLVQLFRSAINIAWELAHFSLVLLYFRYKKAINWILSEKSLFLLQKINRKHIIRWQWKIQRNWNICLSFILRWHRSIYL